MSIVESDFFYKSELLRDVGENFPKEVFIQGYIELYHIYLGKGIVTRVSVREKNTPLFFVQYSDKNCTHSTNIFHVYGLVRRIKIHKHIEGKLLSRISASRLEAKIKYYCDPTIDKSRYHYDPAGSITQRADYLRSLDVKDLQKEKKEVQKLDNEPVLEEKKSIEKELKQEPQGEYQKIIQLHREKVIRSGKTYNGYRVSKLKDIRITFCYSCHGRLDSRSDVQCNNCDWLVCHCGACGCGYYARRA